MNLSVKTANTKAIQIGDEFRMNSPVKTPNTKAIQFSDEFRMNSSAKMVYFQHKRNQDELRMGLLNKSDNQLSSFLHLSVQFDRNTSLPCRDKPIFMKYSTFKAISKISYADTGTRALSIK